jgi:ATP-binding cassette subfamily F protein 3
MLEDGEAGYGERKVLQRVRIDLSPGDRIGLLGPNGAGKSTLIKVLAGTLALSGGKRLPAQKLQVGYFAQHQMDQLRPDDSPLLHLQRLAPDATEQELRDFLGGFAFIGDKALEPVAPFSGGEKARLALALLIWKRPNLLLLDEPTNHLDLEMRQALSEALQEFEGALVVVSHDRHLLRVTSDDLLLVDAREVTPFEGDLDDYPAWLLRRQARAETNAASPSSSEQSAFKSRKSQRRQEAEERKRLQPIRQRLRKLEEQLEAVSARRETLEQELGEPALYEPDAKTRLLELLGEKQRLDAELDRIESAWMEAGEELERQAAQVP